MKVWLCALLVSLPLLAGADGKAAKGRRVEVQVTAQGYRPRSIQAAAGERLVLVFKAAGETGCCGNLVVAGKAVGAVEKDKPLEVSVTVPPTGKVVFACSMYMCLGEVVAK
jgi:hypothetical protein